MNITLALIKVFTSEYVRTQAVSPRKYFPVKALSPACFPASRSHSQRTVTLQSVAENLTVVSNTNESRSSRNHFIQAFVTSLSGRTEVCWRKCALHAMHAHHHNPEITS